MVSTRRKTITTTSTSTAAKSPPAADALPSPSQQRNSRRLRTAAAPEVAPVESHVAVTSASDRKWAQEYRELVRREKEANNRTLYHRIVRRMELTWHHYRISLVPFMLDPWEQVLYILGICVLMYGVFHALSRCLSLWAVATDRVAVVVNSWVDHMMKSYVAAKGVNGHG